MFPDFSREPSSAPDMGRNLEGFGASALPDAASAGGFSRSLSGDRIFCTVRAIASSIISTARRNAQDDFGFGFPDIEGEVIIVWLGYC
jgi:hypothetical protein